MRVRTGISLGCAALVAAVLCAAPAAAERVEFPIENAVQNGGLEGGQPVIENPGTPSESRAFIPTGWSTSENRFAGPVCSVPACPESGDSQPEPPPRGSGPNDGTQWAWFGRNYAGEPGHEQSISQTMGMPAFKDGVLRFHLWASGFGRPLSSLVVKFDSQTVFELNEARAIFFTFGTYVNLPIGDRVDPGQHTLTFKYTSPSGPGVVGRSNSVSVDTISLSATGIEERATPAPPTPPAGGGIPAAPASPPDTQVTKAQLYSAKQGKTGSAKKRPLAKTGKTGRPATAKFTFTGSGGSGELRYECKLDLGRFAPCGSPATFNGVKPGPHVFEVRAVDAAGNIDPTPARHEFKAKAGSMGKTK